VRARGHHRGLDGTHGQSTLAAAAATALRTRAAARTPRAGIARARGTAPDVRRPPVARAFCMRCNYVAAVELAQLAVDGRPTVVAHAC
jgi:hypothetical protein